MPQQSFIYGGNAPGAMSYEEMQRQRELAQALAGRVGSAAPSNIGEGLSAIGAALASRKYRKRATEAEAAGRAQAAEQFQQFATENGLDPAMMGAFDNPYMSDGQKAVASALFEQKFAKPKRYEVGNRLIDDNGNVIYEAPNEPEYNMLTPDEAKGLGLDPSKQYQRKRDGKIDPIGGSGTTVNVGGQNKFEEELAKRQAATYDELQKSGRAAQEQMSTLYAMKQLAANPGFYSGVGGESVAAAKRLAQAFGLNPEGVDSMEAFSGLAKGAALGAMGGSLGSGFSNADRDFVMGQVPTLQNSPEGNALLIEIQMRMAQRRADIAQLAEEYSNSNGGRLDQGFDKLVREYAEANPVFEDMDFGNAPAPKGVTEDEISAAMEKYRLTREQVLEELKKRQAKPAPQGGMY
jgi:hypothetical protein